jgi:hypothetical protein
MLMFQVIYENGERHIIFAKDRADAWSKHPLAWRVYEIEIK